MFQKVANGTVVRFALTGMELPRVTETLQWGNLARRSAMAQYGRRYGGAASPLLAGKNAAGDPLQGHNHAFFLSTDENSDGHLDRLTVWVPAGLQDKEIQAVSALRVLNAGARKIPAFLNCLFHGDIPECLKGLPVFFACARRWRSLTPYVLARHVKFRGPRDEDGRKRMVDGPEDQVRREVRQRWPEGPYLVSVNRSTDHEGRISPLLAGGSQGLYPANFLRYRSRGSRGGGAYNFQIEFEEDVCGPIALGFGCHYGLGLFVPIRDSDEGNLKAGNRVRDGR